MADLYHEGNRQAPGSIRHAPARRPDRGADPPGHVRRRRPRVHRVPRHVLPRDRGRARDAAVLLQGRRSRIRPRPRRADARVPELRRQRHVPVAGQPAAEPPARDPVHRLREPEAAAGERARIDRRDRPAARRLPGGAARGAGARERRPAELPPVRAPDGARRALTLRPARRPATRRSPTGRGATGRTTCCRKGIPPGQRGCCPTETRTPSSAASAQPASARRPPSASASRSGPDTCVGERGRNVMRRSRAVAANPRPQPNRDGSSRSRRNGRLPGARRAPPSRRRSEPRPRRPGSARAARCHPAPRGRAVEGRRAAAKLPATRTHI